MLCSPQWLACPSTAIRGCRGIRDSHWLSSFGSNPRSMGHQEAGDYY